MATINYGTGCIQTLTICALVISAIHFGGFQKKKKCAHRYLSSQPARYAHSYTYMAMATDDGALALNE